MGRNKRSKTVVIVGGGPAGFGAALAAARNRAKVILVEKNGFLGGNMVIGLCLHTFHNKAGDKVIQGIPEEFVKRSKDVVASVGPVKIENAHMYSTTPVSAEGVKMITQQMLEEVGVTILFFSHLAQVKRDSKEKSLIRSIIVCNKGGLQKISGDVFIDTTGDGDLASMAGVPYEKGRPGDGFVQPASLVFKMGNVDIDRFLRKAGKGTALYTPVKGKKPLIVWFAATTTPWNDIIEEKGYFIGKDREWWGNSMRSGECNINATRLPPFDATDPQQLSQAEILGRKQVRQMIDFLTNFCDGFENAYLLSVAPFVGIRESRRILGEYVLTGEDILTGQDFPDSILQAGYPIDIHDPKGPGIEFTQISGRGTYYVPYRCLLPRHIKNLLVSGRCISQTHDAHAATRVMLTCMAMGQAAGTAAAVAVMEEKLPPEVDIAKIQNMLCSQGGKIFT
jgi:hypothetical protein